MSREFRKFIYVVMQERRICGKEKGLSKRTKLGLIQKFIDILQNGFLNAGS